MPAPDTIEYGWGYLEDSAPGWWVIHVTGPEVQADWHVLNKGVQGQLCWKRGEKAVITKRPSFEATGGRPLPELAEIRSVRLRAAGDSCRTPDIYRVSLNGTEIGIFPRLEYFDARQYLEIAPEHWPLLKGKNELTIHTPDEPMTIGAIVLEVETEKGWVRSTVSDYYANTNKWDRWGSSNFVQITGGERIRFELCFAE